MAVRASAGWTGYPLPSDVSFYGYAGNHYVSQLYSALVERCSAAAVSLPSVVDSWTVYAGQTNNVTTNTWVEGGATNTTVVTNYFIVYKTVTATNRFEPFEYSYTNPVTGATVTNMCYPTIKRSWLTTWDTKFDAVLTYFVNTNEEVAGSFNSWFSNAVRTNLKDSAQPPYWTKTNLFRTLGIGYQTNAVAHWTHTPEHDSADWLLAAISSTGPTQTQWTYKKFTALTNMHPRDASIKPIAEYVRAGFSGPNVLTNLSLTLRGWAWNSTGTGLVSTAETVAFDSTNAIALSYAWGSVTSITCTAQRPNSNDAVRIVYKEQPTVYDTSPPYRLYSVHVNERQTAINALVWSGAGATYSNGTWRRMGNPGANTNWSSATAAADATWPSYGAFTFNGTYGTYGYYPLGSGFVQARGSTLTPIYPAASVNATNIQCDVEFYWYSMPIFPPSVAGTTGCVYDATGTLLLENQFAEIYSTNAVLSVSTVYADPFGTTNKPPWCADPLLFPATGGGAAASLGYNAHWGLSSPGRAIYKWQFQYQ
jgi:hypothetical protein